MYETPGRRVRLKESSKVMCDEHSTVKAMWRLTGETDSFGSEYHYECEDCRVKDLKDKEDYENSLPDDHTEHCEIGRHSVPYFKFLNGVRSRNTLLTTDPTEGGGRIYNMCYACLMNLQDNA